MNHTRSTRPLSTLPLTALFIIAAAAIALCGCASTPPPRPDAPPSPPTDFILALTVLVPPGTADPQPARHIIEADWVIRTAVGPGATPRTFPPRTRQLSADQVRDLWATVAAAGMLDPNHPARIGAWPADAPPPLRPVHIIELTAEGEHRVLAIDSESAEAREAEELAARLAELTWMRRGAGF